MDVNTTYSCQSDQFNLISAIDKKITKSPLSWSWGHVKGYQDEQGEPMERWEKLNVECDHIEKLKCKEDQLLRDSGKRKINIQEEIWRFFINVPTRSGKKTPTLK